MWHGRDMACELNPGFQFDHGNEGFEYLVKQLDLLLRMTTGPGDKQIGDARECPQLLFRQLGYPGILNFINQRGERCHGHWLVRHLHG